MKKLISLLLIGILSATSFVTGVSAENYGTRDYGNSWHHNYDSDITIYRNGVKIHGKYYTKAEFMHLLETAEKIPSDPSDNQTRAVLLPGVYFIPGIGQVTIAATGAIIIGGAVVYAGSWLYDAVVSFFTGLFASKAEKYEKAKKEKQPTDNHSREYGRNLPGKGESYSSKDLYENGKLKQRRYYGENGRAEKDVDYFHQDAHNNHTFPHCHDWVNGVRNENWYPC